MQYHPVANIFPLMAEPELDELAEDIKQNGQQMPIYVKDNLIVDGRNRWIACERVSVEPILRNVPDGVDLVPFVVSLNLKRRHLSESQRAMVASNIANLKDGQRAGSIELGVSQNEAARMLNVSRESVKRARKVVDKGTPELAEAVTAGKVSVSAAAAITELPKQEQAEIVARGEKEILKLAKEIRAKKREKNRQERVEKLAGIARNTVALDDSVGKYPIIYADPPWRYDDNSTDPSRAIENQYPTMSIDEILALPVQEITTDDALLFMWTTSPMLYKSMSVLDAWGFSYKTCAVWDKEKIGMGYYFRQQHEFLLVAEKGNVPKPPIEARISSVVRIPRDAHSKKPSRFYDIIQAMYPDLPKIELFARNKRSGWAQWGNQV